MNLAPESISNLKRLESGFRRNDDSSRAAPYPEVGAAVYPRPQGQRFGGAQGAEGVMNAEVGPVVVR